MHLIPQPLSYIKKDGSISISGDYELICKDERLKKATCKFFSNIKCDNGVKISIDFKDKEPEEGYKLAISKRGVEILGNSVQAAFWGIQTLRQLINE